SPSVVDAKGIKLAMVQGSGNVYRIAVLDRTTNQSNLVSPGSQDEAPSFAPNGSMLLYAASEGSRGVLYAVSADGRVRQRLGLAGGDARVPSWGPFRQRCRPVCAKHRGRPPGAEGRIRSPTVLSLQPS